MFFHQIDRHYVDHRSHQLFLLAILTYATVKMIGIVPIIFFLILYGACLFLRKLGRRLVKIFLNWMAFPVF